MPFTAPYPTSGGFGAPFPVEPIDITVDDKTLEQDSIAELMRRIKMDINLEPVSSTVSKQVIAGKMRSALLGDEKPWEIDELSYMDKMVKNLGPSALRTLAGVSYAPTRVTDLAQKQATLSPEFSELLSTGTEAEIKYKSGEMPKTELEKEWGELKEIPAGLFQIVAHPIEFIKEDPFGAAVLATGVAGLGKLSMGKLKAGRVKPTPKLGQKQLLSLSDDQLRASTLGIMDDALIDRLGGHTEALRWVNAAPIEEITHIASGGAKGKPPKLAFQAQKSYWRDITTHPSYAEASTWPGNVRVVSGRKGGTFDLGQYWESAITGSGEVGAKVTTRGKPTSQKVIVPDDFIEYTGFKDAKAGIFGGTKDITRLCQEIDGSLSMKQKVAMPGQAGPVERYVMFRTRDQIKNKMTYLVEKETQLRGMIKGISDKGAMKTNRIMDVLDTQAAAQPTEALLKNPRISAITKDPKLVRFAQESRKYFDQVINEQNEMKILRGQEPIPYRKNYTPHELQKAATHEKAFGWDKTPEIYRGPEMPDFIKPDKPFNPYELARQAKLPEMYREMNLKKLLEHYTNTAARDIFDGSIIPNNKAFVAALEDKGLMHAGRSINDWTAEAFGGVRHSMDKFVSGAIPAMRWWRTGLIRSAFPLNFAWNTAVQTSSSTLTVARYGAGNSMKALVNWFGDTNTRKYIHNRAYSAIVKSGKAGKITQQDLHNGMKGAMRLERGKLETATDYANFFTESVERHLTGWSCEAARLEGVKRGLKGKALDEFMSDGGAKTQSMYNHVDLPGMLRSELIKTAAPFQTFSFEVMNTFREFAGKTGTPPPSRVKFALRFMAGATAFNLAGNVITGRKPWEAASFIPFYGTFIKPVKSAAFGEDIGRASTRGLPSPVGFTAELVKAMTAWIARGDFSKMRKFTIRSLSGQAHLPGGTQINRVVDGLIAISQGGKHERDDPAGKMQFPILESKDKMRALFGGPWSTSGGQEFLEKRTKEIPALMPDNMMADIWEAVPVVGDVIKENR